MVGRRDLAVLALAVLCAPVRTDCRAGCLDCCLFKKRQSPAVATTASPPTTVGYAPPAGSCGAAYCEQTVVQYVPQIAYRTAFQPVPVTTYKTTTSINPANGLPMRCTQPCTSYTYQARRVPYTTYRPVYTTVPVTPASSFAAAQGQLPAVQGQASPSLLPGYTPSNTTLAPISYANPGSACTGCQAGGQLGQFQTSPSTVPYASAPQTSEATPWESSAPQTSEPYGATPWRAVEEPSVAPPTTQTPADVQPSLRPNIDYPPLQPIPQTQRYPDDPTRQGQEVGYGASNFNDSSQQGSSSRISPESSNSQSPNGIRPRLEEPTNNRQTGFDKSHYNSRAVRDLDRERSPREMNLPPDQPRDKTAMSPKTRFASVPMVWPHGSTTTGSRQARVQTTLHEPLLSQKVGLSGSGQREDSSGPAKSRGSRWNDGGWMPTH